MEWVWYILAALGAGIGTGLAGLSAATVMVPILIVLCPSFERDRRVSGHRHRTGIGYSRLGGHHLDLREAQKH